MDKSTKQWLDNDYWRVYTGILGLTVRRTMAKIKADFRKEHEALVTKYHKKLKDLNDDAIQTSA